MGMQQLIAPSSTITKATHTTATGVVVEYYNIMFSLSNMSAGSDVTANLLAAVAVCGCCFWLALRSSAFWPLLVLAAGCCNTQWLVCRWLETSIFNLLMPYVKWLLKFTAKKCLTMLLLAWPCLLATLRHVESCMCPV